MLHKLLVHLSFKINYTILSSSNSRKSSISKSLIFYLLVDYTIKLRSPSSYFRFDLLGVFLFRVILGKEILEANKDSSSVLVPLRVKYTSKGVPGYL